MISTTIENCIKRIESICNFTYDKHEDIKTKFTIKLKNWFIMRPLQLWQDKVGKKLILWFLIMQNFWSSQFMKPQKFAIPKLSDCSSIWILYDNFCFQNTITLYIKGPHARSGTHIPPLPSKNFLRILKVLPDKN